MIKFYDMESSGEFSQKPIKPADKLAENFPRRSTKDILLERMRAKLISGHYTNSPSTVKVPEQKPAMLPAPQVTQEVKT